MRNSTLCYLERAGQYLMLHRVKKKHDVNQDKWIGVGGKFEDGESPEDCLLREVREETGLTLKRYRFRGVVTFLCPPWETEYMFLFTADDWTGTLTDCDEGELAWVDKEAVTRLPIWEGDKLFLRLMAEEAPVFSLKLVYEGNTLRCAVLNGTEVTP